MRELTIGILAHVDAGKTTLSEALLYESGMLRKRGRVDHRDSFLDHNALERERGITIFSKQAIMESGDLRLTLLDTPGHVDFSAEMERTLSVLDLAILVLSAPDGVQAHTRTLMSLFERYGLPVFVFVNKMDMAGAEKEAALSSLRKSFGTGFVDFSQELSLQTVQEELAVLDENLLSAYLEEGRNVERDDVVRLIRERRLFPCFFGSALKGEGVASLLQGLSQYAPVPCYGEGFSATVFKISRDEGKRLTFLKLTGGRIAVKERLACYDEKIDQLRLYHGNKYETVSEASAGMVVALTGITKSRAGERINKTDSLQNLESCLQPVLNYSVICSQTPPQTMLLYLRELEEEDPSLRVTYDEETREIRLSLMGQVQQQVVKKLMEERFHIPLALKEGTIIYKETIRNTVEGVGHFEPLRHYAEVHLLLSPMERGSGLTLDNRCSSDILSVNFQNLILTHLNEKRFRGVLTGSEITDLKITLMSGKAHIKHTEGGDFRQAAYRAVRQGLMQAESVLLEPWYAFALWIPDETVGRAMQDLNRFGAEFTLTSQGEAGRSKLEGTCPVKSMMNYAEEVRIYTKGTGELSVAYHGYRECADADTVIGETGYEAERDIRNSADSVFCSHGAGVIIPWDQVPRYMHLPSVLAKEDHGRSAPVIVRKETETGPKAVSTEEIDRIIARTYFSNRKEGKKPERKTDQSYELKKAYRAAKGKPNKPAGVLVDGYNLIFSWPELSALAKINIDSARDRLVDILSNYQGLTGCALTIIFDAYRLPGHKTETLSFGKVQVVYTGEGQTADGYIEAYTREHAGEYAITVVTSDGTEQVVAAGAGCLILSSRDFQREVIETGKEAADAYLTKHDTRMQTLGDSLPDQSPLE